jgi:hypothetical protein
MENITFGLSDEDVNILFNKYRIDLEIKEWGEYYCNLYPELFEEGFPINDN